MAYDSVASRWSGIWGAIMFNTEGLKTEFIQTYAVLNLN